MKELITVGLYREANRLTIAALARKTEGAIIFLGAAQSEVEPLSPLHKAVRQLLVTFEEQSELVISEVACHHANGCQEDLKTLTHALMKVPVTAIPISHEIHDAVDLALRWALHKPL
jgi:hypothetical protein